MTDRQIQDELEVWITLEIVTDSFKSQTKCYKVSKKIKLSRYTPWRHMGGEEV
jgi:hypothetical protein